MIQQRTENAEDGSDKEIDILLRAARIQDGKHFTANKIFVDLLSSEKPVEEHFQRSLVCSKFTQDYVTDVQD